MGHDVAIEQDEQEHHGEPRTSNEDGGEIQMDDDVERRERIDHWLDALRILLNPSAGRY